MSFEPSPYQQAIYNEVATTDHNINVNAVAGSGKTTTLLGCLERIPRSKSIIFFTRTGGGCCCAVTVMRPK